MGEQDMMQGQRNEVLIKNKTNSPVIDSEEGSTSWLLPFWTE